MRALQECRSGLTENVRDRMPESPEQREPEEHERDGDGDAEGNDVLKEI